MTVSVKWVGQGNTHGCGIACLAMLTGQTFAQVAADFSQPMEDGSILDLKHDGVSMQNMDRYLAERGFAVRRLYLRDLFAPRDVWPPEPFAEVHLCLVKIYQNSPHNHWVVMLRDGTVLDPHSPKPRRLKQYYLVLRVAGVYHVDMPESTACCKESIQGTSGAGHAPRCQM